MDTSKKYIKMCSKAKEIQELWKPRAGDFNFKNGEVDIGIYGMYVDITQSGRPIWLPRQDQLQDLIKEDYRSVPNKKYISFRGMSEYFYKFVDENQLQMIDKNGNKTCVCESMEQLWLAFVMREKYNKIWNGRDWVKEI